MADPSRIEAVPPYRIELTPAVRHALARLEDAAWNEIRHDLASLAEGAGRCLGNNVNGPRPRVGAFQSGQYLIAYDVDPPTRTISVNDVAPLPGLPAFAA